MAEPTIEVLPQPRVDVLVDDAGGGGPRRLTTYAGTVWVGGRMDLAGRMNMFRHGRVDTPFFVPDSLPYDPAAVAHVQLSVTIGIQATGEDMFGVMAQAVLVPDPGGQPPMWVQVQTQGTSRTPMAYSYRVDALSPPDVVLAPPA
jgi:hypothetical protein